MDPAALEAIFRDKPALHRYPGSMAKRTHALCAHLVEHYDGRADGGVERRARPATSCSPGCVALPGFGKARRGSSSACSASASACSPPGWEVVAADWPSIADVDTFERVGEIREKKRR